MVARLRWAEPDAVDVPHELRAEIGGHPLVAETLVRRGFATVREARGFLAPSLYTAAAPEELPDLPEAVARIGAAVRVGERILVWGDFDVDGQTSTTLLVSCFRDLGGLVTHHIPIRETESHGMRLPWFAEELARGADLVVTCDTGIDAHEAVTYARERGVDVVITDHHEPTPTLPDALAVVNPHRVARDHPLATLPGVGVAYKLAEALYAEAGQAGDETALLDLVALGIVADVATQTGDTRYLLQRGLKQLRETKRLGLQELMRLAKVRPANLTEENIGFGLAPRLNALGRLDDANVIVEFLTTADKSRARIVASQLQGLNAKRRQLTEQVQSAAEAQLARNPKLLESAVLVMGSPEWPAGIIGIVANRLLERYDRPVILLKTPPGEDARGSARSVEGCHITEAIATQSLLLTGFGGHAAAAGVSLPPENIDAFRRGVSRAALAQLAEGTREPTLSIDGYAELGELSLDLALDLRRLAPFGPGNPPLTLAARDVQVAGTRTIGRSGRHARITLEDKAGTRRDVVWWNWVEDAVPEGSFDLAFTVGVNHYRGDTSLQLEWQAARRRAMQATVAEPKPAVEFELVDLRRESDLEARLRMELGRDESAVVWAEGPAWQRGLGQPRHLLEPARSLIVWSRPPGVDALRVALRRVSPQRLVLMGGDGGPDGKQAFLRYLGGLVKTVLDKKGGAAHVPLLAALSGHREHTVRAGLTWLAAKGSCVLVEDRGEVVLLARGKRKAPDPEVLARTDALLRQSLADTLAYRRHFLRVEGDKILALMAT